MLSALPTPTVPISTVLTLNVPISLGDCIVDYRPSQIEHFTAFPFTLNLEALRNKYNASHNEAKTGILNDLYSCTTTTTPVPVSNDQSSSNSQSSKSVEPYPTARPGPTKMSKQSRLLTDIDTLTWILDLDHLLETGPNGERKVPTSWTKDGIFDGSMMDIVDNIICSAANRKLLWRRSRNLDVKSKFKMQAYLSGLADARTEVLRSKWSEVCCDLDVLQRSIDAQLGPDGVPDAETAQYICDLTCQV